MRFDFEFKASMLKQRALFLVLLSLLMHTAVQGASKSSKVTHFRPITQSEYDAILSLTDGKPVVSEGRLIASGLAALAGLTTGWVTSLRLSDILASVGLAKKSTDDSYPLCVIKNEGNQGGDQHHEHHEHNNHQHHHHHLHDSYDSAEHDHHPSYYEHYHDENSQEYDSNGEYDHYHDHEHEHDHVVSVDSTAHKNKLSPVVNCIVVVKKHEHVDDHEHYNAPPQHPHERPLRPYTPYPYSTTAVQPPPGSYNNPWYWQTPYYNPYYSNSRIFTDLYPFAYSNIYGSANPSAYPFNYPGIIPNPFTATLASNSADTNNNALTRAVRPYSASSNSAVDTRNTQPSGSTSDYTGMRDTAIVEGNKPDAAEATSYTIPQVNYASSSDYDYSESYSSPPKYKNAHSSKTAVQMIKTKSTHSSKLHQQKKSSAASSSSLPKISNPTKRKKAKRDETGIQSNPYAKIATYNKSAYQPTLYPQNGYTSTYPKLSYLQALPHPAPVYVRNGIPQQAGALNMKRYRGVMADSEEDEAPNDFIQARFYSKINY